jgi:hypothetical protein
MHSIIFDLFKTEPKYIKIIPLPNILDDIKYNNIIDIWNYFKQSNIEYINKYGNFEKLFDKAFNIKGKNYNNNINNYSINNNLNIYKKHLDDIRFLRELFKTHTNIDNINMMIVIGIKNSDDIFISFKSDRYWRFKILLNMNRKNMKEVFKGIKKGPFWTYKLKYSKINNTIKDILWNHQVYSKNCISISVFSD